ncbi:MAG: hypothetical protein FWD59_01380 [Micrococcales bacterium]|nr:hypothetical protein [Micrococcales bacterium]
MDASTRPLVRIFVSHRSDDHALTRPLLRRIRRHGQVHPKYEMAFWDSDHDALTGGPEDQWKSALTDHRVVLQLMSVGWWTSEVIQDEEVPLCAGKILIPLGLEEHDLRVDPLEVWRLEKRLWYGDLTGSPRNQNRWALAAVNAIAARLDHEARCGVNFTTPR